MKSPSKGSAASSAIRRWSASWSRLGAPGLGLPSWSQRCILCGSGRASGEDRLPAGMERASVRQIIGRSPRDLRLDFFRGLSLFFIFLDHVPGNVLSFVTLQSFAFCDAAEVFVFISGYTAALVYGRIFASQGLLRATAHVYRRVGQLYVAHVFHAYPFDTQEHQIWCRRLVPSLTRCSRGRCILDAAMNRCTARHRSGQPPAR
jgi:hypothetical protein